MYLAQTHCNSNVNTGHGSTHILAISPHVPMLNLIARAQIWTLYFCIYLFTPSQKSTFHKCKFLDDVCLFTFLQIGPVLFQIIANYLLHSTFIHIFICRICNIQLYIPWKFDIRFFICLIWAWFKAGINCYNSDEVNRSTATYISFVSVNTEEIDLKLFQNKRFLKMD